MLTAHDPETLLPTVRSRCQRLHVATPPKTLALDWLSGPGVTRPEVLLAAAGGHALEAIAMARDGVDSDAWERVPGAVRRGHAAAVAAWPLARLVDALQKLCHDLMCLRAGAAPRYFDAAALAPLMQLKAPSAPRWTGLAEWAQELVQAARHDEHPWHAGLRSEALIGQGTRLWQTARSAQPASDGPLVTLGAR